MPPEYHAQYGNRNAVWSGDIVYTDEHGFLYFVGRTDDMIKSSGYRISPAELEEALFSHHQISEIAAIGISHEHLGQQILLVIKPNKQQEFSHSELLKHCKKTLPNFMQPHGIEVVNSLPRNPNGKINRTLLKQQYTINRSLE